MLKIAKIARAIGKFTHTRTLQLNVPFILPYFTTRGRSHGTLTMSIFVDGDRFGINYTIYEQNGTVIYEHHFMVNGLDLGLDLTNWDQHTGGPRPDQILPGMTPPATIQQHRFLDRYYHCPDCGSDQLQADEDAFHFPGDAETNQVVETIECLTCGKRYTEVYQLIGFIPCESEEK